MQFPYAEVEFTSTGAVADPTQLAAAVDMVASSGATDVLLLSHGWNNDMPAARRLYEGLMDNVAAVAPTVSSASGHRLAVIGLLWPSVKWADEDDIAGGGAAAGGEAEALVAAIRERIEDPAIAARLIELIPELETSAEAREEFLHGLRAQLPTGPARDSDASGTPGRTDEDPPPTSLVEGDAERVFDDAGGPDVDFDAPERAGGGAALDTPGAGQPGDLVGGAARFGFDFGGALRKARNLLNVTTYYTMKDRAGKVGANGVAQLLDALSARAPQIRQHLAGHSFGARVVAAAAAQHPAVHSVTLLQGAFSHHGFAANFDGSGRNGFFRGVLASGRLTGPVLITHTRNDRAVGLAYAIASRLARQDSAGLGDAGDPYGGIGRNGALKTPEIFQPAGHLLEVGGDYAFKGGRIYNLEGGSFIRSHGDVTGRQAAYALLSAVTS